MKLKFGTMLPLIHWKLTVQVKHHSEKICSWPGYIYVVFKVHFSNLIQSSPFFFFWLKFNINHHFPTVITWLLVSKDYWRLTYYILAASFFDFSFALVFSWIRRLDCVPTCLKGWLDFLFLVEWEPRKVNKKCFSFGLVGCLWVVM